MAKNLIFDLETLGTTFDSVVLSIGCTAFDFETGEIDDGINIKLSVEDQIKNYKRICEQGTIDWWKKQDEFAREILKPSDKDRTMDGALNLLNIYIKSTGYDWKNSYCFSRGTAFDFPILEHMYKQASLKQAYNTWKIRDVRTFLELLEMFLNANDIIIEQLEQKNNHNSLEDCKNDAMKMIRSLKPFL